MPTEFAPASPAVLRLADADRVELDKLLKTFDLTLVRCADDAPITGSYWGDDEAGLQGNRLYARADTPLHSILHETCHYICAAPARRRLLDTNAGSDDAEENAVCYLQVLLADQLGCMGRARMLADMDAWGYSFRLGSSARWFTSDADDARQWLLTRQLVDANEQPLWCLRSA